MKRGPLLYTVLIIELMVGLILLYNFRYLAALVKQKQAGGLTVSVAQVNPTPVSVPQVSSTNQLTIVTSAPVTQAPVIQAPVTQAAATQSQPAESLTLVELSPAVLSVFGKLPAEATPGDRQITDEQVDLGRMLFYEARLSATQDMSCNTCHLLDRYGVDSLPVSVGHDGKPVKRNAPTVYNAAFHIAQFWDGRSPNVEEQAKMPIVAMGEMGLATPERVDAVLRSIPGYEQPFAAAFPNQATPITYQNVGLAIGAFERRLSLPSRFDQFLAGDRTQLTADEQRSWPLLSRSVVQAAIWG